VEYVIASKQLAPGLGPQRFEITCASGAPFEARSSYGTSGTTLTLRDSAGREVASVRKRLNGMGRDLYVDDEKVAHVQKNSFSSRGYSIDSDYDITGEGNFGGGEFKIAKGGTVVATTVRQRWPVKFAVDIDDGEDQVLFLGIALALAHDFVSGDRD
jgi:uncharacterized protein YxjI